MTNHELKSAADAARYPKSLSREDALKQYQRAHKQTTDDDRAVELAIFFAPGVTTEEERDARQAQRLSDLLEQATGGEA